MNKIKMEVISIVKWEDKEVPVADLLKELLEQNAKQKNSIDKAIEYIETNTFSGNNVLCDENKIYYNQTFINAILNILKGE